MVAAGVLPELVPRLQYNRSLTVTSATSIAKPSASVGFIGKRPLGTPLVPERQGLQLCLERLPVNTMARMLFLWYLRIDATIMQRVGLLYSHVG